MGAKDKAEEFNGPIKWNYTHKTFGTSKYREREKTIV